MDSPLQPVDMGPTLPVYPEVCGIVRVTAASIGGNVYPAFAQQYAGGLAFRDREAVYAWEPNGVVLGPGRYDARLVGSYLGLPLYVPTCCPSGSFPTSSSSSSL